MDLKGSEARVSAARCRPVPPNRIQPHPTAADWIPLILRFQILEAWIWRPGAWMPGCWQDWNGLEEVTEVTAFWGGGIGRNSHTLKLQDLGGSAACRNKFFAVFETGCLEKCILDTLPGSGQSSARL